MKNLALTILVLFGVAVVSPVFAGDEASPGEILVRKNCNRCHVAPKPGKLTKEELKARFEKHGKKLERLTEEEKETIAEYLKKAN